MNVEIRPEAVRKIRARKGFKRAELADKAQMSERQIFRIEGSTESKVTVREHTLNMLARAFRVSRDVLEGKEPLEGILEGMGAKPVQKRASAKLDPALQKDFDRVVMYYGIKENDLIALAPLMFTILAEGTIAWHDEKAKRVKALMDEVFDHAGLNEIITSKESEEEYKPMSRHFYTDSHNSMRAFTDLLIVPHFVFGSDGFYEQYVSSVNPFIFYLHNLIKEMGTDKVKLFPKEIYPGQSRNFSYSLLENLSGEASADDPTISVEAWEDIDRFFRQQPEKLRKEGKEEESLFWEENLYCWEEELDRYKSRKRVGETDSNDVSTQSQHESAEEGIQVDSLETENKTQGETND